MNPKILDMEYAVRGKVILNSIAHAAALKRGESRPFPEVVICSAGNPHATGQKPLTFVRQVLSLCTCPSLLENKALCDAMPADVVARAKKILGGCHGMGAYSDSRGIEVVRESVKAYIENRDGYPTSVDDIYLTNGASEGVHTLLAMLVNDKTDGVMVPIPQYPLYSADCTRLGGTMVSYYLDEANNWATTTEELDRAAAKTKAEGITLRCICVINPGNPTGQVLTEESIKEMIAWSAKNKVMILADEVYQVNIYDPNAKFHSFKKVLRSMPEYADKVELISFHTTSKGIIGECGMRGGYMETTNIHPGTKDQIYKALSVSLCSNLPGQVITELMVNEPKPGDPSYESYMVEWNAIFQSLQRRALKMVKAFNSLEGYSCNPASGALYAFPQMVFPKKWLEHCKELGTPADTQYCIEMTDATGITVVPGSGFGQVDGTWHFRTTILPPEEKMDGINERLAAWHAVFMKTWKSEGEVCKVALKSAAPAAEAPKVSPADASPCELYAALPPEKISPKIKEMEYAVRGKLVLNAQAHIKALKSGEERPFPEVVLCNIGNPQSVGQPPLTFPRQVLALCTCPKMLEDPAICAALPPDAVARAKKILSGCAGLGAYCDTKGVEVIRQSVQAFIEARDGYPTDTEDLYLTDGASQGVKTLLLMLVRGKQDGVMVPIPQYPLYSATCTALGGTMVNYYLDEAGGWALTTKELDRAAAKAKADGIKLRCICVINPGNPTGQVLSEECVKEVIAWAGKEGVLIMADEVYQSNVYDPTMKFHSFKKVLRSMPEYADKAELVSFHSTSKGVLGECGMRGGYMELVNVHPETKEQVYKLLSVNLCSNLPGQVMCELMVNEPKPGDPSYEAYKVEYDEIFRSLQRRAVKLVKGLNSLEGYSCSSASGAMYAFPRVMLPTRWVEQCKKKGVPADT